MKLVLFKFAFLVLLACGKQDVPDSMPIEPAGINYLALGDSYTIGQSVATEDRYPLQLQSRLETESMLWNHTTIIAQTGWRTDQLHAAIEANELLEKYDLVSLLIGVNNQFQGGDLSTYESEFTELLERAIALAGNDPDKVFVLSIPDYAFTPFGQNSSAPNQTTMEIDQFNAANKTITENFGVVHFDITPISRMGLDRPELVASDNLHPSGIMYAEWVELMAAEVLEKIK